MGTHGFWRRLISLTRKEFRQLLRDRSNLMIGIGLPIVLILIFGFGLSLDVKQASIAVAMQDRSPQAREVVNAISQSPYMTVVPAESLAEATLKLDRHEVDALLLVQNDFSRNLSAGHAQVQLITQGGDPSR
ncbi:MAG: ABC transporter permease, partial [Burkholderiaceae bacterium]